MSEWTLKTLKSYVQQRFADQEKAVAAALAAAEKAVNVALQSAKEAVLKAESASDKRFDSVNEFRAALNDQSKTLISRAEVEQRLRSSDDKMDGLTSRMDRLEGRSVGLNSGWGYLVGAIGLALIVIEIFRSVR